jgi:hypothetical protein
MKFKDMFYMIFLSLLVGCAPATPAMTSTPEATPTPVATQTATQTPSPTATLSPEQQITAMVNEAKETGVFPTGLTKEQDFAFFKELNDQCGLQTFVFPVPGDPSSIMVNVPPQLYPNFAEEFSGVIKGRGSIAPTNNFWKEYGDDSSSFILPTVFFDTEEGKAVAEKLRQEKWVHVDINPDTNQLSVLFNGKLMIVPDSEKLVAKNWQEIITKDNINEKISSGEFIPPASFDLATMSNNNLVPAILLPIPDKGLTRLLFQEPGVNAIYGLDILPMLRIHMIPDGSGKLIPVGEVFYLGNSRTLSFTFLKEDSKQKYEAYVGDIFREGKFKKLPQLIENMGFYYALVSISPKETIDKRSDQRVFAQLISPPTFAPLNQGYELLKKSTLEQEGFAFELTDEQLTVILIKKK